MSFINPRKKYPPPNGTDIYKIKIYNPRTIKLLGGVYIVIFNLNKNGLTINHSENDNFIVFLKTLLCFFDATFCNRAHNRAIKTTD